MRGGESLKSEKDRDFEAAKQWFDSQERDSLRRKPMKSKEVAKMVGPARVIAGCILLSGTKKTVDRLVR